jgi:hypothetical protein
MEKLKMGRLRQSYTLKVSAFGKGGDESKSRLPAPDTLSDKTHSHQEENDLLVNEQRAPH